MRTCSRPLHAGVGASSARLAAHAGWGVHHMDIKSTFLNGELQEEVYIAQPPGYATVGQDGMVVRLDKAMYGLK